MDIDRVLGLLIWMLPRLNVEVLQPYTPAVMRARKASPTNPYDSTSRGRAVVVFKNWYSITCRRLGPVKSA